MESEFIQRSLSPPCDIPLDRLKGLDSVIRELEESVLKPVLEGEIESNEGVMLCGAPGTGKTALMSALQATFAGTFMRISVPEVLCLHSISRFQSILEYAGGNSPCVLFLDEIDMQSSGLRECLARWMEGKCRVGVVAATAYPWRVEGNEGFRRKVYVPMPSREARREMLAGKLSEEEADIIVSQTEGYTGADLVQICKAAEMVPVRECVSAGYVVTSPAPNLVMRPATATTPNAVSIHNAVNGNYFLRPLTLQDYQSSLSAPSVSPAFLSQYQAFFPN